MKMKNVKNIRTFSLISQKVLRTLKVFSWIKKFIQRKLTGAPTNLGIDLFLDPVKHFGGPLAAILGF